MSSRTVEVVAPSRLHFGLISFGKTSDRQFGGVGVMVSRPSVHVQIQSAEAFAVVGEPADRVELLARRWIEWQGMKDLPKCHIDVVSSPRMHVGLGVGTQLGLAVAAGLNAYLKVPTPPLWQLAKSVERGLRSAVGTYGFAHGGMVSECGRLPDESISPIDQRVALPADWRFVLFCPSQGQGLHGDAEKSAFASLPSVPREVSRQLSEELHDRMLPAAAARQFETFSDSVYQFGYQAGLCFSQIQGGAYNGGQLRELVERIQALGVRGVGQSSWGPTIFAVCRNESDAHALIEKLNGQMKLEDMEVWITSACNDGARVTTTNDS